ncbi:MAG: DUF192 domain-containing protein, partial [Elusimicrobiota bacterium]|nr:DUF192 domain-containing protein [Elusimicrobiota bacterium]
FSAYKDGSIIKVQIGENTLNLTVAKSDLAKAKGLSNRKEIPQDGMIFLFDEPQILVFWMKDMLFAIDIIWINQNKVLGFYENAAPQGDIPDIHLLRYRSPAPSNIVIELKAGSVKKLNIKKDDLFRIKGE